MYLSRFGVKNYKCLGEIEIPLTPIHVLIGENDAGKSSLLEAIEVFCASAMKPLANLFPQPWKGRELVLSGHGHPIVEVWGEWSHMPEQQPRTKGHDFQYGIAIAFPESGRECWLHAEWTAVDGKKRGLLLPSTRCANTSVHHWKQGKPAAAAAYSEEIERVVGVLKPAYRYALQPSMMRLPAAIDPERKGRLDPDGFGLPTLLGDIVEYAPEVFIRLRTEFCRLFPQFKSVHIESEDALKRLSATGPLSELGKGLGKALYFDTHRDGAIRAEHASDGAVLLLAFLALAHLPDAPNLLLVEEPENGVYPKRLGEVIKILKEMVKREDGHHFPQIILTTHSPFVLSFFEPEEVTFLSRPKDQPDGPVRARPLREAPNIKERMGSEFYLGELWYNLSEEDLFGEV
jgi:predicted ATPase